MILAFTGTLFHLVSGGVGVLYVIAFVCITMPSLTVLFCYISELFTVQCMHRVSSTSHFFIKCN